ncbi:MAG: DnaJ C-terminal domain-containing protein, partial [Candidatus Margulisiibacteriota bacterium]
GQAGGGFGGGFDTGGMDNLGDMFDMFFGGSGKQRGGNTRGPVRGSDLRADLTLTLEQAFQGVEKEIDILHLVNCSVCKGTGAQQGTKASTCSTCAGRGAVRQEQRTFLGNFATTTTCPNCGGAGTIITNPCKACQGKGVERKKERVKVSIPAGVEDNSRLRISGAGDAGYFNGPAGDLYIYLSISDHSIFERAGDDLHSKISISFVQAALGAEMDINTIDGKVKLKIPAGTQSHTSFRLRDKGMTHLHSRTRGSLEVRVEVVTPTSLTREQRDILNQFGKMRGEI